MDVRLAVDYTITGRQLYKNWLDGNEQTFRQGLLNQYRDEGIILAIVMQSRPFAWEVLHDGNGFLVQRGIVGAVVIIRDR
ncbi:hypothetical protein [Scytonema sp. PRP1]|uniref:hypothetical protein n=1 Tax=Scytonema sp. PRP1 TaxID=3120513 RepID=UPI00300D6632